MGAELNVRMFGAAGDGCRDDSSAIQAALDAGRNGVVRIPEGVYRVSRTLCIHSDTVLRAEDGARIFHCGSSVKREGDFLLTCDDGSENITLEGGVWDGNFDGVNNTKPENLFEPGAWSGAMLNFVGVKNLTLRNLTLLNSVTFYVRMARVDGFLIEHITMGARRLAFNQDGLHFGGECRNGIVRDIEATDGETNDDLIALNADDSLERLENRGLVRGPIENIEISDIRAKDCYTFARLASVTNPIRNIRFCNISCGCRMYAVNMDGARYCRTPLFKEEEMPEGSGLIENVSFENFHVYATAVSRSGSEPMPLICAETQCRNFTIRNFSRDDALDVRPDFPTVRARNLVDMRIEYAVQGEKKTVRLSEKADRLELNERFDSLSMDAGL